MGGNVPGTGMLGTRFGGSTQSSIAGIDTSKYRSFI
jgi:hypothetical protein